MIRRAATNRVLNVLRHWVSKHPQVRIVPLVSAASRALSSSCNRSAVASQDFELNTELKLRVIGFLEEVMHDPELLTQERKAAANIIRLVGWLTSRPWNLPVGREAVSTGDWNGV